MGAQVAGVLFDIQGAAPSGEDLEQRFLNLIGGDLPIGLVYHDIHAELAVVMMGVQGVVVTGQGFLNILKEFDSLV